VSKTTDASVQLAQLAAGEDISGWQRVALDKLAAEIGLDDTSSLPNKGDVIDAIQQRVDEHARATEPEPTKLEARTYEVTGPHMVHGCTPGGTFTHVFTPEQEAALVWGGHIKQVTKEKA
jgi:hypothetical protein